MRPPVDIQPSELWLKLCEPIPSEVVDFPRKDRKGNPIGKVRIQVLRMEDHNKARLVATKALKIAAKEAGIGELDKNELETDAVREVLGDLIAHELLCMACLTDEKQLDDENGNPVYGRVFGKPSQIREALTADETLVLFNAYRLVQFKYGPFEKTITEDGDIEAWISRLKEGGSEFPLLALPLPQLVGLTFALSEKISSLCHILAFHQSNLPDTLISDLRNCFTDTFLFGEQLSNSTQNLEATLPQVDLATALKLSQQHKDATELGI